MLRPLLIGLVAGQRSMTPLAVLAGAARQGRFDDDWIGGRLIRHPLGAAGAVGMAALEMAGDKMKSAPDRTVFLGLLARTITGSFAGAAIAPKGQRAAGAAVATAAAIGSSYLGLALRKRAMARFGQDASGFAEDVLVLGAGVAAVALPRFP
ncbi:MAG TPA: DUF4126 domain-containing protein [Pseudolabrys sp.]